LPYVEVTSEVRTKLGAFFNILLEKKIQRRQQEHHPPQQSEYQPAHDPISHFQIGGNRS
jgi:hypothetical protein